MSHFHGSVGSPRSVRVTTTQEGLERYLLLYPEARVSECSCDEGEKEAERIRLFARFSGQHGLALAHEREHRPARNPDGCMWCGHFAPPGGCGVCLECRMAGMPA